MLLLKASMPTYYQLPNSNSAALPGPSRVLPNAASSQQCCYLLYAYDQLKSNPTNPTNTFGFPCVWLSSGDCLPLPTSRNHYWAD
jgi:hypothetical protein